jgi:Tol biopolymer transport system component
MLVAMLARAVCLLIAPLMFAQSPAPFSTPETFGTALNPEGTTAYFSRSSAGKPPSLMASHLRNGRWTDAELLPFAGKGEGDPAMAPDGSRLVFWSWRPSPNKGESNSPVPDLWYVDIASGRYGEPRNIPNSAGYGGPSLAADGTLYCFRGPAPGGKPRLVRALRSGDGYGRFENLPDEFNGGFDPFIAPDQSYIIFASDPGDLYISYRRGQGWTPPVNLGPKVNSSEQEYCPSVSRDGMLRYFTRARQGVFVTELAELGVEAARLSTLEVGVGLDQQGCVVMHHRKLRNFQPLFRVNLAIRPEAARLIGMNAARLVKVLPFKPV